MNQAQQNLQAYGRELLQEWNSTEAPLFAIECSELEVKYSELDEITELVAGFERDAQSFFALAEALNSNSFASVNFPTVSVQEEAPADATLTMNHPIDTTTKNRDGLNFQNNKTSLSYDRNFPYRNKREGLKKLSVRDQESDRKSPSQDGGDTTFHRPGPLDGRFLEQEDKSLKTHSRSHSSASQQLTPSESKQEKESSPSLPNENKTLPQEDLPEVLKTSDLTKTDGLQKTKRVQPVHKDKSIDNKQQGSLHSLVQDLKSGIDWNWNEPKSPSPANSILENVRLREKMQTKPNQQSTHSVATLPSSQPVPQDSTNKIEHFTPELSRDGLNQGEISQTFREKESLLSKPFPDGTLQALDEGSSRMSSDVGSFDQERAQRAMTAWPAPTEQNSSAAELQHFPQAKAINNGLFALNLEGKMQEHFLDKDELLDHLTEAIEQDYQRFYGGPSCP